MKKEAIHNVLTYLIAFVWLLNGLVCKVLSFIPRHEYIVSRILGDEFSGPLTMLIGFLEIGMAIWVYTRYKSKLNAIAQIVTVATMNILEFILVPDLLLWGRLNIIFATLFIGIVFLNEFILNKKIQSLS